MSRSRTACGLITAAAVSGLLVALPAVTSSAATGATNCPTAFPTDQAVDGVKGTGYTVEKGTKADPFTAKVLGRITDGIGPGIDMIMADLDSPALERAGGVWAGMSGSPVYTEDGKLIGSVSYGLVSPSNIAGITPAEDMLALREEPASARRSMPTSAEKVTVSDQLATRIAKTGEVTKAQAKAGFTRMSVPVSVSGLAKKNTSKFTERIEKETGSKVRALAGKASTGAKSSPGDIFAGSNYAAALSYGDVTLSALGTTTYVCDSTAVAFGHPFFAIGPSEFSLHPAEAVYVQPDPTWGPFKVGNPLGRVGNVNWDGTVGVRGTLGENPPHEFPITTDLVNENSGKSTKGTTVGVYQPYAADIAAIHLQSAIVKALGVQSQGSAEVKITVKGTRGDGKDFKITHDDYFADTYDISYATADSLWYLLYPLADQPYEELNITSVKVTGKVSTTVKQFRVSKLEQKVNSKWQTLPETITAKAGSSIQLRAVLKGYRNSDNLTVPLSVQVPDGAVSGNAGSLTVADGRSLGSYYQEHDSLDELLEQLNEQQTGNELVSQVDLYNDDGTTLTSRAEAEIKGAIAYYYKNVAVNVQ
ncbi:hypothetical protein KIH74_19635 [Kineosporia sp. J2-2]|uniref:Peptidase S55 domain-containing protein n=2 Tax=Kineosporia corallincola TaxID=2835133 RepID=A0ABS5TJA2_9ACTN|nr:hypothetical protein [Kineosporia corallincola]